MFKLGPSLLERVVGWLVLLLVIAVLLEELRRLVRAYAGWIVVALIVTTVLSLIYRRRRW